MLLLYRSLLWLSVLILLPLITHAATTPITLNSAAKFDQQPSAITTETPTSLNYHPQNTDNTAKQTPAGGNSALAPSHTNVSSPYEIPNTPTSMAPDVSAPPNSLPTTTSTRDATSNNTSGILLNSTKNDPQTNDRWIIG